MRRRRSLLAQRLLGDVLCVATALLAGSGDVRGQADAWQALRQPGHAAFMRHSDAPGAAGDPTGFRLDDCATQRNLSEDGRAQARRTGAAFARNHVAFDQVLTSPWCRCRETARLDGEGGRRLRRPEQSRRAQEHRDTQIKALRAYLAGLDGKTRVLFVTHGIVIAALTGVQPASGEMVIVMPGPGGEPKVVGRLKVE